MRKSLAALLAAATVACSLGMSGVQAASLVPSVNTGVVSAASTASVTVSASAGYAEGAYAEWQAVTGASGYNVYADGTKIDSMLIRQYASCFRADAVGLKAGSHTLKIVPVISGSEDTSKAAEVKVTTTAHDRTGFGWVDGTSSGAYNEDGTLRSEAVVLYVTEKTKDTVSMDVVTSSKGETTASTGIQNILTAYQKGYDTRPLCIRCIGNITDPGTLMDGDLLIKGSGASKRLSCGVTIEGIGNDTTFNGFGLRIANASNVEVRNIGFMNCNSGEGDNVGLQQNNDHVWVHHCDMFYGDAGSDADQVKGDGALDTKTSTYITHSYNHFWDNGKCNLQGMKSESTDNYITYHHNWYDHSDSRHPRIRTCSVHIYNNYFDGNAKYGVGVTMGASAFVENNYFRNCKYPMLASMQGSDIAEGTGTFSSEDGGIIKAYNNTITGDLTKAYVTYQQNSTEFDAYEVTSATATVPSSVVTKQGGTTYNNFDTSSVMYKYTAQSPEEAMKTVVANAGRVQGGDFKWTFNNSVDDASYTVDTALKAALVAYKDSIVAIGSGFSDSTDPSATTAPVETTVPAVETTAPANETTAQTTQTTSGGTTSSSNYTQVIFASPNGTGSGKTETDPTDALTAIKTVPAGGIIYLLGGNYSYTDTIVIDQNNSGSAGKYKTIAAYKGADVVFDFTGQATGSSARGIVLDGNYWHFYGFQIYNAGDNGMLLSGNNNIIEMMVFNDNEDTGLQLSRYRTDAASISEWPTNNLVKNCTSKNNCDEATMENADGFAAKLTCGEGNVFDGCLSYNNSDDGWDLYAKEETGPIGVVTIKNCVAFRNGFTEDGRGYGDADGNGFKLGGGGIGTRHVVENCLAFENLNCGFTDNNNPLFGDMKNCTAYNNGIGGNGKANYMVYRCAETATFANMMSYINTANVSKTNAAGIKVSNDKFVGKMTNSIYYNSKYYYAENETMTNGAKLGTNPTVSDSDFANLTVAAMGADFHKTWRNADGSPNPGGFAETATGGSYATIGYRMSKGITQTATPAVSFDGSTATNTDPVQTTATTDNTSAPATDGTTGTTPAPVVSGDYVHNFTLSGLNSSFYSISGNLSTGKGVVSYAGLTLTQCLKIETATSVTFTAPSAGKLTLVFAEEAATIKVNDTKYTASGDGIITVDVPAGANTIAKADSANLFYMAYTPSGEAATSEQQTETSSETTTTTTVTETVPQTEDTSAQETTAETNDPSVTAKTYGDVNGDDTVDILDVIALNKFLLGVGKLDDQSRANADVDKNGSVDSTDSLNILKKVVEMIELPVE